MPDEEGISRSERLRKLYDQETNPKRYGLENPSLLSPKKLREHYERTETLRREIGREASQSRRKTRRRSLA
jgi:hypothetical protein